MMGADRDRFGRPAAHAIAVATKAALLLALAAATPARAADEDAAHRADRLETRRLNTRVLNRASGRHRARAADGQRDYARAQAEYQDQLDAWRRRVAACEAGHHDACQ